MSWDSPKEGIGSAGSSSNGSNGDKSPGPATAYHNGQWEVEIQARLPQFHLMSKIIFQRLSNKPTL